MKRLDFFLTVIGVVFLLLLFIGLIAAFISTPSPRSSATA